MLLNVITPLSTLVAHTSSPCPFNAGPVRQYSPGSISLIRIKGQRSSDRCKNLLVNFVMTFELWIQIHLQSFEHDIIRHGIDSSILINFISLLEVANYIDR